MFKKGVKQGCGINVNKTKENWNSLLKKYYTLINKKLSGAVVKA